MKPSRVLAKVRQGEPAMGIALHLTDPSVYEMAGLMGFDAIWMDMEHHFYSVEVAANLMRAARVGGTDIVARPGKGEFMRMARMFEAGATGVMYPRCDSAGEAREVVKWAKFAPLGKRGFDGSGPDVPYLLTPMKQYIEEANRETFVLIQLEEPHAVERAEEIAAVPGVDMLMLGPADFTVLTGIPGDFSHPTVTAAIEKVAKAAKNTGKNWAATCGSVEVARRMIAMGARLVFHGCDLVFVKNGFDQLQATFGKELGLKFARPNIGGRSYLEGK
ncbi:MAG TPA: aldolase/citrate lyase family protein [Tepidisphaeraceae bacterium]|nr:aldolase/citrate lyase family protein [Tepidisphaeraceae bacterium]